MAAMTGAEPWGVLVIRAWIDGNPPRLKARITHAIGLAPGEPESAIVSGDEEILAEVRHWLDALEAGESR